MVEYSEKCTLNGAGGISFADLLFSNPKISYKLNDGNAWMDVYGGISAYAGAIVVKFKTPSFVGGAATLTLNCKMLNNDVATTIRCAVCTRDSNWQKYIPNPCGGKYYVEDEYRIADGELFCQKYSNPGDNDTDSRYSIWVSTTIRAEKLKPSTQYILYLYPMGDNASPQKTYFESMSYTDDVSIEIGYNKGLGYIDFGSDHEAYQCYVDNGTGWDMLMPYIDNGSGWDLYT